MLRYLPFFLAGFAALAIFSAYAPKPLDLYSLFLASLVVGVSVYGFAPDLLHPAAAVFAVFLGAIAGSYIPLPPLLGAVLYLASLFLARSLNKEREYESLTI